MRRGKFERNTGHRRALFRGLVTNLILRDRIRTTETKAKAMRPFVDHMISLSKRGDLHARRQAASFLLDPVAVRKLFNDLGPKFAGRPGGYTRIIKIGPRRGDSAQLAVIEFM